MDWSTAPAASGCLPQKSNSNRPGYLADSAESRYIMGKKTKTDESPNLQTPSARPPSKRPKSMPLRLQGTTFQEDFVKTISGSKCLSTQTRQSPKLESSNCNTSTKKKETMFQKREYESQLKGETKLKRKNDRNGKTVGEMVNQTVKDHSIIDLEKEECPGKSVGKQKQKQGHHGTKEKATTMNNNSAEHRLIKCKKQGYAKARSDLSLIDEDEEENKDYLCKNTSTAMEENDNIGDATETRLLQSLGLNFYIL